MLFQPACSSCRMLGLLLAVMCAGAALGEDCGAPIPGGGGRTGNVSLTDKCITVMGFNIQVFGLTKMGKPDVVTSLEKVSRQWSRWDVFQTTGKKKKKKNSAVNIPSLFCGNTPVRDEKKKFLSEIADDRVIYATDVYR